MVNVGGEIQRGIAAVPPKKREKPSARTTTKTKGKRPRQIALPGLDQPVVPTFDFESRCATPVAGVDEAGRGALAGPVVAAAVILDPARLPQGIDDSKKLNAARREVLYQEIMAVAHVGVGEATCEEIDEINILQASFLAMRRAVAALPVTPAHALVDGNLPPGLDCPVTCVVSGDALSLSIAAASIIAKVHRDRILRNLSLTYPAFAWDSNAGYGTPEHLRALSLVGPTPFHRKSFAPVSDLLTQESEPTL